MQQLWGGGIKESLGKLDPHIRDKQPCESSSDLYKEIKNRHWTQ